MIERLTEAKGNVFTQMCFFFQSKFQKHQAFEAEVSANQERVLETINLAEGEW